MPHVDLIQPAQPVQILNGAYWRIKAGPIKLCRLQSTIPNHYATLGLDRRCSESQIRTAYRILARQHHPDVNASSTAAVKRTQELNAAYEILSDPARREAYDAEVQATQKGPTKTRTTKPQANLSQDVYLRLEDFLRGTTLEVRVNDPGQANQSEIYPLTIPPQTAPGTRFKIPRTGGSNGFVLARVKARPDFRFKIRGSDLRCDLKITNQRALQGGTESVRGLAGNYLRVAIPRQVARGEIICLPNEGLPKTRGGRGDLQVRILYRPEVRITRATKH